MGLHDHGLTFTLTPGMAPAASLVRMLASFDRQKVEALAEISIALLDMLDGDPDLEDATDAEDDDPDTSVEDDPLGFDPEEDYGADDVGEPDADEGCRDEFADPVIRAGHRRRIQRTRCQPRYRYKWDWRTGEVVGRELIRYSLLNDAVPPPRRALFKRKRGLPRKPRP